MKISHIRQQCLVEIKHSMRAAAAAAAAADDDDDDFWSIQLI